MSQLRCPSKNHAAVEGMPVSDTPETLASDEQGRNDDIPKILS